MSELRNLKVVIVEMMIKEMISATKMTEEIEMTDPRGRKEMIGMTEILMIEERRMTMMILT